MLRKEILRKGGTMTWPIGSTCSNSTATVFERVLPNCEFGAEEKNMLTKD
jgi:hypothetical protein